MTKKTRPPPSLRMLDDCNPDARNRLLLAWLEDDKHRSELFRLIREERKGRFVFPSRDSGQRDCECVDLGKARAQPVTGHRLVALVTDRHAIEEALLNNLRTPRYSSRIYAELGGGSFMLALDPAAGTAHAVQRAAYKECFPRPAVIGPLAEAACDAAAVMALKSSDFDLAHFAEQAALRFCQMLMGYSFRDYPMLEETLRAAYRGLVYQVWGRHFVTDPIVIPAAKHALGLLLARTSKLIDAYEAKDEDELKGCDDPARPGNVRPVLEALGEYNADLNGEQRAVIAVGAVVGTVGNVQAAACIAVSALFANRAYREDARALLRDRTEPEHRQYARWQRLIQKALAANPPIPFLPRFDLNPAEDQPAEIILALGGATRISDEQDPLIWGLPEAAPHHCAGQALAWPLIVQIVRRVMALPGLEERRDPHDVTIIGLKKRWGFACESYPLSYQRERRIAQASLNVAMRLRSPVQKYAAHVREVIRAGAPRIEEALRSARHVHFAWFELTEGDTVLVLHTVYDGPLFAYVQDFALRVGDLFDALFECIENPPPMPVGKFPSEFVAHIQRYDRAPATGYFFSAYPQSEVARIERAERALGRDQEREQS